MRQDFARVNRQGAWTGRGFCDLYPPRLSLGEDLGGNSPFSVMTTITVDIKCKYQHSQHTATPHLRTVPNIHRVYIASPSFLPTSPEIPRRCADISRRPTPDARHRSLASTSAHARTAATHVLEPFCMNRFASGGLLATTFPTLLEPWICRIQWGALECWFRDTALGRCCGYQRVERLGRMKDEGWKDAMLAALVITALGLQAQLSGSESLEVGRRKICVVLHALFDLPI
ncbi:hypothetical protein K491DRAFT_357649 [Lophiostoma macrostomum CBS 122681]|uniref:Uncharacterized protein n=1 Tax=Lophiostoma macrostomum CBS 122681 TaxID=1314788 RepID=A0A6A6T9Z2_9PLEO|nr:hypothetical protein K491DRAFT_357649 [Lophiostoma macrostomum CBS 122681]